MVSFYRHRETESYHGWIQIYSTVENTEISTMDTNFICSILNCCSCIPCFQLSRQCYCQPGFLALVGIGSKNDLEMLTEDWRCSKTLPKNDTDRAGTGGSSITGNAFRFSETRTNTSTYFHIILFFLHQGLQEHKYTYTECKVHPLNQGWGIRNKRTLGSPSQPLTEKRCRPSLDLFSCYNQIQEAELSGLLLHRRSEAANKKEGGRDTNNDKKVQLSRLWKKRQISW